MAIQTPRGTYDILPSEISKWQQMEQVIRTFCSLYDYQEIRTPMFEDTAVFKRENDSSDMVNKEMYTFNMGDDSFTLRPEGTAGVIRSFCQQKMFGSSELPVKLYYMGPMFRHERPQKGRQRQFNQFGVENIGVKNPLVDAETIAIGYSIVKSMGISSIKVLINTLGDDESRNNYRRVLKEYFVDHLDELCGDCKRRYEQNPLRILDCKVDGDSDLVKNAPKLESCLNDESKAYFNQVLQALDKLGIPYEINDRLVRGLDYYTHTVFEVVSTHDDAGSQSTIFGGGRYDHLVDYFGGPQLSGVGFAIGLERLLALSEAEGYQFEDNSNVDVYIITLGNPSDDALDIATQLRAGGYKTEMNVVERSMKSQFKSVERKHAKYVVIIGEDEIKNKQVNIKNTNTQQQETVAMDEVVAYLDKAEGNE